MNGQFPRHATKMGGHILSVCLEFLNETSSSFHRNSSAWMCVSPAKRTESSATRYWEDDLEMFDDFISSMKEGLSQIRDVVVDRCIRYQDARHQESLVPRELTKTLGYSFPSLFTLHLSGGNWGHGEDSKCCLDMRRILASNEVNIVWNEAKHLHEALGHFRFVWETARAEGVLKLQGHSWCVGAEDKTITYKGNPFYVIGVML
ncbi:hypothetical protein ACJRO7_014494 [Eucalyptus globulus]|uniref:Uncharacterized protein n=1 Tax=Eucalyptus globulus TaxID=34317 RepID=A0ABD3LAY8_EUCGL